MVETILQYAGEYIKQAVPFLDVVHSPVKRLTNGVIYKGSGSEKKDVSINDQEGKAAYMRLLVPEQSSELPAKTSCGVEYRFQAKCRLLFYSFSNVDQSEDKIKSILSTQLNAINFKYYAGSSYNIKINIVSTSTDFEKLFQEETSRAYEGDNWPIIIAVDFNLTYEDKNCFTCDTEEMDQVDQWVKDLTLKRDEEFCEKVADCEVIKTMQEEIKELQEDPPGGLTCETLAECEVIEALEEELDTLSTDFTLHTANTNNPHNVTKAQVGLGNVDNTSDANKPVSIAQAAFIQTVQNDIDAHEADFGNPHHVTLEQARSENNQINGDINANGAQINNLSNAVDPQQAATLNQVDAAQAASQAYTDSQVLAVYRPAGDWDASVGSYPTTGTGTAGAIRRGDTYRITVAGIISGFNYDAGDSIYAIIAVPGQSSANWGDFEHNTQQATETERGTAMVITAAIAADENTLDDEKFVTGKKLWLNFWNRVLALAWTWALKQTFTSAPRFNSASASQYLKTDANKDLTSVSAIPKADVGLSNVDNTSDANKPVSIAQQTALDLKLNGYFFTFNTITPADNQSYYFNNLYVNATLSDIRRFRFKAGTIKDAVFTLSQTTNGSGETVNIILRNVTLGVEYTVGQFTSNWGASQSTGFIFTGLNIPVTTDLWSIRLDTPTFASNPANWIGGLTLNILE